MQDELSPAALAVIEKVAKLMAVAKHAATDENSASNALDLAHKLLEAHNLDMALVERKAGQGAHAKREDKTSGGGLYKWQRQVWEDTAKLNMCVYFNIRGLQKGDKYENRLIGRPENVIMTRVMAEYLQDTIERMAAEWAKDRGFQSRFVRDAIIYREGMAETIAYRLRNLHWERVQANRKKAEEARAAQPAGNGTSLVLASVIQAEADLNEDYLNGLEPGTTSQRKAESAARHTAWMADYNARQEAAKVAHERQYAEDDVYAEAYDKVQAEALAAQQRAERKAAKRASSRRAPAYRETAEDRRRSHSAFGEGREAGETVGLDAQVTNDSNKRIGQ